MNILDLLTDARDLVSPAKLGILDLNADCRAYILSFLDNTSFGITQYTAKGFRVASVPEILLRKIKDYSRCSCPQLDAGPYYHASHNGWIDFANYLKKGEVSFSGGYDCLAGAYKSKQFPMIEWLINNGYKPSYCSFHNAVRAGDILLYERLLRLFPDTPDIDAHLMESALESGSIPMVEHLLSKGISIPMKGYSIVKACESGNLAMVEFVETHWGMTCREVVQKWRNAEREKIINSNYSEKKKNKLLRNVREWPTDILDYSIPCSAIRGGNLSILQKLCQQGFCENRAKCYYGSFFGEALNYAKIEILDWLKEKDLCPSEISYSSDIMYCELYRLTWSEGQLSLHWLQRNGIPIRVGDKTVPATEALAEVERTRV